MDENLKEALQMVKYLRACLGLVLDDEASPEERKDAEQIRQEAADLLRKHGESDDEMDIEDGIA